MTRSRRRKLQRMGLALASAQIGSAMIGLPVAWAQEQDATGGIEEVVVTAQKRSESLQNVPLSIQAIGTARLEELQVSDFKDYAKFLPSVSFQTSGPGFAQVYMRGVASGGDGNHSGPLPSVGIYLDEQPITTIQGALDIHVYDIARVESLAGPQGTLYGASSQAGTIRIITNKPDPRGFKAGYDVSVNSVANGGVGYVAEGFVNLPLSDNAAVRLVGWHEHDAGYIDNVRGTRTFPTAGVTINNFARAKNDYNDVDTTGARAALKIDLDDSWTFTPTIMGQQQKSNGNFGFDPGVGDLKLTHFYPEGSKDRWVQAALTIEGKIGNFDMVFAGSYLKRDVDTQQDYSDYSYFYDTAYGYYLTDDSGANINPAQFIDGKDAYKKQSVELRVSSPQDQRLRYVVGGFVQRQQHGIEQRYQVAGLGRSSEVSGWPDTLWLTEQTRIDRDSALFGEATFDFTEKLSLTGGLRFFRAKNSLAGFFGFGSGFSSSTGEVACFGPGTNGAPCTNLDKTTNETDRTHRLNLSYRIDSDKMVYATWSRGFRPGGINRRGTLPPYKSDFLTNYELGWKSSWAGKRVRFNGAVFQEDWKDFQFALLGSNGLTEIKNAGQARIKGIEADLTVALTDAFSMTAGVALLDAKLTENYCGFVNAQGDPESNCAQPQSPKGTELPVTPRFKANITGRYEFNVGSVEAFVQAAAVYQGDSWTDLRLAERQILGKQKSYTLADISIGGTKGPYSFELFVKNALDERAELTRYAECAEAVCGSQTYIVPTQPRLIGVRFGQKF